ncbi:hypothetical protein EMIHUDRAFT_111108 [Emiliania huxleyi CCMP1516]|uniref:Kringle domain-containing protein n=2 Tax=Emiliania huxleyi TaxID=2903 RepID=A0A0D3KG45_EMIH1|nr:hypothetical protein EMIHUDRAFT_111108 [Emiliania huxleyi CCMP1516]EOD34730.1 hypothetical protein EMIHUDRAFT_111108 [Emiliania huxleyi CCMP1516]|eukprot:XP_005787159.1 hypothetical protein EMIHUDRAFT_111108 [Emiliania huxleyi CCMP1516]
MRRLRTLPWLALLGVLRVAAGDASLDDSTAVTESATPAYAIDDAAYGSDGLERYIDESYYELQSFWSNYCAQGCDPSYVGDGECDETCNNEECDWDENDCFHGYGECYTLSDGSDYRGEVSTTEDGVTCQYWSRLWPHTHDKTVYNYPKAGLGGHNFCRNPDGEAKPWCSSSSSCSAAGPRLTEGRLLS